VTPDVSTTHGTPDVLGPRVRAAVADDLGELVRLDRLAREHLRPLRGGEMYLLHTARPEPPDASLRDDLADVDRVVLLGCLGEVPVGYAIAAIRPLADGTCAAEVSEVFVEPEARGVGIGNLLMHQIVHWASDRGCIGIDARALPGDRDTKNFFESFGLVARVITVHRDLRP
jgi:GNAT superfamily N-acetyltransferase